jgi:RES domain-containing protein
MGQTWLQGAQTAVLVVPSAVVPAERSFLINPRHPDFARIVLGEAQSLQTDIRLLRNLDYKSFG